MLDSEPNEKLLKIAEKLGVGIDYDPNEFTPAVYYSMRDVIVLNTAMISNCKLPINLVLAHELVHASGHASRLARAIFLVHPFSVNPYMRLDEEVIAQLGAFYLLKALGISSSYDWLFTVGYIRELTTNAAALLIGFSSVSYNTVEALEASQYLSNIIKEKIVDKAA